MQESLFYHVGLGETVEMFSKGRYRNTLYDIGIHPETAFG